MQELFAQKFPDEEIPHSNGVRNFIAEFRATGNVLDATRSGRPSTEDETVEDVKERIANRPHKSVRRLALQADISKRPTHDILKKKLFFLPYKVCRSSTEKQISRDVFVSTSGFMNSCPKTVRI